MHDDVVLLNHSKNPTEACFYQIKTKSPTKSSVAIWRLNDLIFRKTGAKQKKLSSILGKLYAQYLRFEAYVKKMVLVSDAAFEIDLQEEKKSTDLEIFCFEELADSSTQKIIELLTDEHGLGAEPKGLNLIHFERTSLSVPDHLTHTEGVISAFLGKEADGSILPQPFHKTLRSEVHIRNNRASVAASFEDMIRHKGISRSDVQDMIHSAQSRCKQDDLYDTIRSQLELENMNFLIRNSLMNSVREYFRERFDQTNLPLVDASNKIMQLILHMDPKIIGGATPLQSAIAYLSEFTEKELEYIRKNYSQDFLHAMFLVLIHEQEPSTTNSQYEEKSS